MKGVTCGGGHKCCFTVTTPACASAKGECKYKGGCEPRGIELIDSCNNQPDVVCCQPKALNVRRPKLRSDTRPLFQPGCLFVVLGDHNRAEDSETTLT